MSTILTWPSPLLEQVAEPVAHGERCRELIEEMFAALGPHGVGLAAPQIGVMKRVIVCRVRLGGLGRDVNSVVKHAIINPELSWAKPGLVMGNESCLSFPDEAGGFRVVSVPRFTRIRVRGFDVKWNPIEIGAKDLVARVLLHEIDHLNGRTLAHYARVQAEAEEAARREAEQQTDWVQTATVE